MTLPRREMFGLDWKPDLPWVSKALEFGGSRLRFLGTRRMNWLDRLLHAPESPNQDAFKSLIIRLL
jgi:hypothetical protein